MTHFKSSGGGEINRSNLLAVAIIAVFRTGNNVTGSRVTGSMVTGYKSLPYLVSV